MKCLACRRIDKNPQVFCYTPTTIDKLEIFDKQKILYCNNCGFGKIEQDVDEKILHKYYFSDYSGKAKKRVETSATDNRTSHSYDLRSISQIALIKQFIDIEDNLSILEIGAGEGNFLFSLKQMKFGGKYIAFEPQEQSHLCLNSLGGEVEKNIFNFKSASKYTNQIDLVVMSHSLEHFNPGDIEEILRSVENVLKKGGVFFCEVPNANIGLFPNAGERVVPHLTFFSINSLKCFIERTKLKLLFLNACGKKQINKNQEKRIKELEENGFFEFEMDTENKILRNKKYHQHLKKDFLKKRKKQIILNILFKIFSQRVIFYLINFLRKLGQKPYSSLISDCHFTYHEDREYIRLVAKK